MPPLSRVTVSGLAHSVEGEGFGDTLNCRKRKDALEKKTPHHGVQQGQRLLSLRSLQGQNRQNTAKSSGTSTHSATFSALACPGMCLWRRFPAAWKEVSPHASPGAGRWELPLLPLSRPGPSAVIQRQVAAGTAAVRALVEAESAACLGSGVQTPCDPGQPRQPGVSSGWGTRRQHRRGGNLCLSPTSLTRRKE